MTTPLQRAHRESYRLTYRPTPSLRVPSWALGIWNWL